MKNQKIFDCKSVYLGANEGNDPCLQNAVKELGTWIGNSASHSRYFSDELDAQFFIKIS